MARTVKGAPKWNNSFDRWKKLLLIWLRSIDSTVNNTDIVSAVILGLSDSGTDRDSGENVLDFVLELEEEELYPVDGDDKYPDLSEIEDAAEKKRLIDDWKTKQANRTTAHPDKKVTLRHEERVIPGLNNIIMTLKQKFGVREEEKMFSSYEEFESLKRRKDQSMNDYLLKFEGLNKKLTHNKIEIPDIILAYRLLKGANLGKDEKLARTSVATMTFGEMKKTLLKMSDSILQTSEDVKVAPKIQVKTEPLEVLYQEDMFYNDQYNMNQEEQLSFEDHSGDDQLGYDENDVYYQGAYNNRGRNNYGGFSYRGNRRGQYNNQYRNNYGRSVGQHNNRSSQRGQMQSWDGPQRSASFNRNTLNRTDANGKITECKICKCIYHWASECPHKGMDNLKKPEVILKLDSVFEDDEQLVYLANETQNLALIDCGAAKTVCGKKWFDLYESSLTKEDREKIKEESVTSLFKFGDGDTVKSNTVKIIPTMLCGQDVLIKASIVENNVPLLISKKTLKDAKANINFDEDLIEMDGKCQHLISTSSGHYAVPVGRYEKELNEASNEDTAMVLIQKVFLESSNAEKAAKKIHRYFAHASPMTLKKFVLKSNYPEKDKLAKEIEKLDCELCKKYKKEAPKPKTCIPMAERFNQTVALDLKFLETNEMVLHCIDLLTRFSAAIIVKNKTKEEIVNNFFLIWISIFGPPEQTLCDNGGEFCNQDFLDMCQNLNINMKSTAAFAPYSNGVVERHNGLLAEMVYKIVEDVGCSVKIALCWAVNAKNSMSNVYGFSPQQLVLGYNTYCPGLDDGHISISQLEGVTNGQLVADHLNAMYQAREAFIAAQNSDRLKRALKGRVYQANEMKYFAGDKVYYRTGINDKTWKGPGIVIGQYQKLVMVKTGGLFVRVHPSKIILKSVADKMVNSDSSIEEDVNLQEQVTPKTNSDKHQSEESDSDSDTDEEEDHIIKHKKSANIAENTLPEIEEETEIVSDKDEESEHNGEEQEADFSHNGEEHEDDSEVFSDAAENIESTEEKWKTVEKNTTKDRFVLNTGDQIRYKNKLDEQWQTATVLGNAGTVKGVNKNRYNVQTAEGKDISIFADRVELLMKKDQEKIIMMEQENQVWYTETPTKETLEKIEEAKKEELKNLKDFKVYDEIMIEECDQNIPIISSRWLIVEKSDGRIKARLVARGFEENEYSRTDAPTVDKSSMRTFLSLTAMNNWEFYSLDVKSAFLQSHELQRTVYLKPPKDIRNAEYVWKIKKPIYGLKDSANNWYKTLREELLRLACAESIQDPTLYTYHNEEQLLGMFICHVDDFLYSGNQIFIDKVIKQVMNKFSMSSAKSGSFTYIGLHLTQTDEGIEMDQLKFIENQMFHLDWSKFRKRGSKEILDSSEKQQYQSMLGKVNWIAHQSRPDLAFFAFNFSLFSQEPNIENLKKLNKLMTKISSGPKRIMFPKVKEKSLQIVGFSDASFANVLPDKTYSGAGFLVFLCDQEGNACLLNWKSKKINRVVHSTLAAECLALVDCLGDAVYNRRLVEEILYRDVKAHKTPIHIFVDCSQLYKAVSSTHMVTEKLLRLNLAEVKQLINDADLKINLHWIGTEDMLSDCLTKMGASSNKLCYAIENGSIELERLKNEAKTCLK